MKNNSFHHHTHSLLKMSTLGLSMGLLAAFFTIFLGDTPLGYSAPSWFRIITGTYGNTYTPGAFDTSPGGGNGGQLTLISESEETGVSGSGLYIDTSILPNQKLIGNFFLETVGWVEMNPSDSNSIELIAPSNMNVMTPWALSGSAWSENAGYITMEALDSSYSGVYYTPGTQTFTGYAWSESLGYMPFSPSGDTGFKNRVKILGNIGGNKAYDVEYALGTKFDAVTTTSILNTIRKNVAIMIRSAPAGKINTSNSTENTLNNIMYYKRTGGILTINGIANRMNTNNLRSIVVEGGDILIDADVTKDVQVNSPRTIIAIKDINGNGGNIYIRGDVKNIYSSLIAENSIYSGDSSNIENDTTIELTSLPQTQLYIYGNVISRNTIGGSARSPESCPYTENTCTYATAIRYDWNYFRTFDKTSGNRSDKTGYDDFSVIIEHDPRIIGDPPPGLTF